MEQKMRPKVLSHLGTSKALSPLDKVGSVPLALMYSSLSPCPGSQDKVNNPSGLLVLRSSQECLENSHCFICHSFQGPARDRLEQQSHVGVLQKRGALGNISHDTQSFGVANHTPKVNVNCHCLTSAFFHPPTPGVVLPHDLQTVKINLKKCSPTLLCCCEALKTNSAWASLKMATAFRLFNTCSGALLARCCKICFLSWSRLLLLIVHFHASAKLLL